MRGKQKANSHNGHIGSSNGRFPLFWQIINAVAFKIQRKTPIPVGFSAASDAVGKPFGYGPWRFQPNSISKK